MDMHKLSYFFFYRFPLKNNPPKKIKNCVYVPTHPKLVFPAKTHHLSHTILPVFEHLMKVELLSITDFLDLQLRLIIFRALAHISSLFAFSSAPRSECMPCLKTKSFKKS